MANPRVLKTEPPVVPLDVVGAFLRIGEQTFIRFDQIVGLRTVEAIIWSPPEKPTITLSTGEEMPDPLEDIGEPEEPLSPEPPASDEPPDDAPRLMMTQIYLEDRYGGLRIDTADGTFTSTPVVRHSLLELNEAITQAAGNRAAAEAKIMSGMIAREITEDPRFTDVEPTPTSL